MIIRIEIIIICLVMSATYLIGTFIIWMLETKENRTKDKITNLSCMIENAINDGSLEHTNITIYTKQGDIKKFDRVSYDETYHMEHNFIVKFDDELGIIEFQMHFPQDGKLPHFYVVSYNNIERVVINVKEFNRESEKTYEYNR